MEKLFEAGSLDVFKKTQSEHRFAGEKAQIETAAYGVETEIGQLNINAHILKIGGRTYFNAARDFFTKVGPRERWLSQRFGN
ncbi:MAG: hypothetical protein LBJ64_10210 [Deltaproteobacteria bacterium]|jgi:hypothetical protein|nr:hypothetical protein [Deltaproteobacteria bacterium]